MNPRIRYCVELDSIKHLPDNQRVRAEVRFLLIKEYDDTFVKQEKLLQGKKFRKCPTREKFCKEKGVSVASFSRWELDYKKHGIEGLVPQHGARDRKACSNEGLSSGRRRRIAWEKPRPFTFVKLAIPPKKPLKCLIKLSEAISRSPFIADQAKQSSLSALKFILDLAMNTQKAPLALNPPLTETEKVQLEQYRLGPNKKSSVKAKAIMMMDDHRSLLDIGMETAATAQTIYRWHAQFNVARMKSLVTKHFHPRREAMMAQRMLRVIDIVHKQPSFYDINRTSWTLNAIAQAYQKAYSEAISPSIVNRIVRETGSTWKHARKVWTSPDPLYREKIGKILDVLRNLKVGEAFFFIDEAGPYQVKKYGGIALTPSDMQREVPEVQVSKGSVQFIAALEALSNKVTWRFISSKSTRNIITMLEQLCSDYSLCSTLYVTWDDISCHRSHALLAWVNSHNDSVSECLSGPMITIVPLPSRAQFLNVVEAVLSGMKKAIIYNSDYGSKEDMEEAISRHFVERNQFFQENPKRAGNKIWDKEAFDLEKLPGGLFKKM